MIVFGGLELVLAELAVGVVAGERLEQFPSFPGRQLSQDFFAFTQAQPLQEPDLLHLQHAILPSRDPSVCISLRAFSFLTALKCPHVEASVLKSNEVERCTVNKPLLQYMPNMEVEKV